MFVGMIGVSLWAHTQRTSWVKGIQVITVFFAFSISSYHLGVESHWWSGPHSCTRKPQDHTTDEPLLERLEKIKSQMKKKVVLCDQVAWRILGLSATFWNTLTLAILLTTLGVWWKKE
jgi:disulfide bond formation protein DsbB